MAGAAKAGTSSLYHYLTQHPAVFMSHIKEPHYLCSHRFPPSFTGPGDEGFSDNVVRNETDYLKLYSNPGNATVLGDASVYYLYYPDTPRLIRELNPDAKVIIILRNPVDRAFSAYSHTVRDGRETLSFEQALEREHERREMGYQPLWWYKEVGMYAAQVKRYLDTFDRQHLRIYLYEDLKDMSRVIGEIISFLGIDQDVPIDTSIRHNASGVPRSRWLYNFFAKPNPLKNALKPFLPANVQHKLGNKAKNMTLKHLSLRPETRFQLTKELQSDIKVLEGLIGRDLSHWVRVDSLGGAIAK
ncbi:sulfotransferase family protein [Alicyclobacillus ferrooxydans]|uniref:sulfotransferase family protein n=1 Tax=Alicyclobacillus ferrooxydans TaxID=471514 RepID=UPI00247FB143|nr:sulfotransferase [Alicyclobacillus ferrooxydans]